MRLNILGDNKFEVDDCDEIRKEKEILRRRERVSNLGELPAYLDAHFQWLSALLRSEVRLLPLGYFHQWRYRQRTFFRSNSRKIFYLIGHARRLTFDTSILRNFTIPERFYMRMYRNYCVASTYREEENLFDPRAVHSANCILQQFLEDEFSIFSIWCLFGS